MGSPAKYLLNKSTVLTQKPGLPTFQSLFFAFMATLNLTCSPQLI